MVSAMQLSNRVQQLAPSATLAVTARVKELKDQGVDVIGFGVGEPDFQTPDHIKNAAIEALQGGATHYMPVPGEPSARQAIADKLRAENSITVGPDDVIITVGAKHAVYLALQCLIDPPTGSAAAQEVLLPTPAWVSYRPMIELAGGRAVDLPTTIDTDFKVTAEQLAAAVNDRTAAILLNSPSNPCGTMYSPDELRALATVLAEHPQVVVIADEIYEKLIYGDAEHLSIGSLDELAERTVTINGLSKAYAMTGWRVGYAAAPKPSSGNSIIAAMSKLQGQMTSNITSFCYAAINEALAKGGPEVERMRQVFAERAKRMKSHLDAMPGVRCPDLTGAFYAFPDISTYMNRTSPGGAAISDSVSFAQAMLDEAHVAVVPGEAFGEAGQGHIRLSFACSNEQIDAGCQRIADWLGRFGS